MNLEIILIILLPLLVNTTRKSYKDYNVYVIVPSTEKEVEILERFRANGYNIWTETITVRGEVKIMVAPEKEEKFIEDMRNFGMDPVLIISDIQTLIDGQYKSSERASRSNFLSFDWDNYHPLNKIETWLEELQERYPEVVTVGDVGTSYEGRSIKVVTIDFKRGERNEPPLIGVLEGGIHSNEWISPATVTWVIKEFLTSNDPQVRTMAESFVWHFIPVMNPDGYVYTFTNNRMWRKNRNTSYLINNCTDGDNDQSGGVDLNRNFDFLWNLVGTSDDPCHHFFSGSSPLSEPETQAMTNYMTQLNEQGKIIYYISFHSYTQLILLPHSHLSGINVLTVDNYPDLYEISIRAADKLKERYGTIYTVGTASELLYAVSGASFDWVKGILQVPIAKVIELRDLGFYGFLLPADQIVPNNEEMMDYLVEMDKVTRLLGYYSGTNILSGSMWWLLIALLLCLNF